jgi:DNA polymerase III subunit gamma/tau
MENFVVSARKYRPQTFDTVVGQSHITTTLKNAIQTQHLAQAFLFCGPRGVGKTTCARILAKTINCQALTDEAEACGTCDSCKSFQQNASLNVHELDAASNNSVDDIRNLIDQVRYPPQVGSRKVYIIDEVHMLSTSAFNAFLKTLEEPPSYAIFILATTEKHKILPTILSRCQIFDFNRIQVKDMADHLAKIAEKENVEADYEALELIAQKAEGGLRDALSMFDLNVTFAQGQRMGYAQVLENLHILDYDYFFKMTDALLQSQQSQAFLLLDEILKKGFDGHQFLIGLLEHFRNLLVCKDPATVQLIQVSERVQQKYLSQSAATSMSFLASALSLGSTCDLNYKASKNQRLHLELWILKLAQLPHIFRAGASVPTPTADTDEKKKSIAEEPAPEPLRQTAQPAASPQPTLASRPSTLRTTTGLGQAPKTQETPEAPVVVRADRPLVLAELQAAWQEFVHMLEQKTRYNEYAIVNRAFRLEGTHIHLEVDNQIQVDALRVAFRTELLNFLREKVQNSQLHLEVTISEQPVERRPYTQSERFQFLAEKNPILLDLKQNLGLDYDY